MSHDTPHASPEAVREAVDRIVSDQGTRPEAALPILQALQRRFRYLPAEALERVCAQTEITPAQLTSVATFYPQFRHEPLGRHLIQVCHGTACHVAGAPRVTETLRRHLAVPEESDTSPDGEFTIAQVACLGCCALAPVMLIDDIAYGHLDPARAIDSIESFKRDLASGRLDRRREEQSDWAHGAGRSPDGSEFRVGLNSCCIASGGLAVREALEAAARRSDSQVPIKPVGCRGICYHEPLIEWQGPGGETVTYVHAAAAQARRIARRHLRPAGLLGRLRNATEALVDRLTDESAWREPQQLEADRIGDPDEPYVARQHRIVTEGAGERDPLDFDEYHASGGYEALRRAREDLEPREIVEQIRHAGLRGRGGGGYPTAAKMVQTLEAEDDVKYVVCNGDEGDPGAFMDRMLLEGFPHRVLEGLAIAAHVIGAREAWIYVRAEYPLAVHRIQTAIAQARDAGILGDGQALDVHVLEGAGAFVCGEETALLASIEGRRGMPRYRPPYPSREGLFGRPTLVQNVETLANLPFILREGPEAFAALGTPSSRGTKTFALAGKVRRGGLIEVPMGTTIYDIVHEIGGGAHEGHRFKAVQIGGPSGGCLPARLSHTPVDYEDLVETGAIMGSGGLVVLDETDCMVEVARFFLEFTQNESCGRCTFCRIGTRRMLEILEALCAAKARRADLERLEELAREIPRASLCGLGRTAPNPVLTTLRYFRDEYEAHLEGRCPAHRCPALIDYAVTDRCIGCTLCARACPVDAIEPRPYEQQEIDRSECVRCGICASVCPEAAIETRTPRAPEDDA